MPERKEKSLDEAHVSPELLQLRKHIDRVDSQIISLLKDRIRIVEQVGELKRKQGQKGAFLRPGREADMLRRVWKEFSEEKFSPVAAAAIWRIIIAAMTQIESEMRVSVYAPEGHDTLYWLAREYFGSFTPIIRQPNGNRVIGDVVDGKAEVGILPPLQGQDAQSSWWLALAQQEENAPRLFAHIPFVTSQSASMRHSSFAIARVETEPTAEDISLLAVETSDISINRVTTAFAMSGLKASRIHFINNSITGYVHHLLEVNEFLKADDPRLLIVQEKLGDAMIGCKILGAYAPPIKTTAIC